MYEEEKVDYGSALKNYLTKAAEQGLTKTQIKKSLIDKGWPKRIVEKYLKKLLNK